MYPYMYAPTLYVLHTQMYVLNANTRPPLGSLHAYQLFPIDDEQGGTWCTRQPNRANCLTKEK